MAYCVWTYNAARNLGKQAVVIIPITITVVDWNALLVKAKEMLNWSISESIDTYNVKEEFTKLFLALREMQVDEITDPRKGLEEAGSLLRHASCGFLCMVPTYVLNGFREEVDLEINSSEANEALKVFVVSGTMLQWRNSIVNCCSDRVSIGVRQLANGFLAHFDKQGLTAVWHNFTRTTMQDKTTRLIQR